MQNFLSESVNNVNELQAYNTKTDAASSTVLLKRIL